MMFIDPGRNERLFQRLTSRPRLVLLIAMSFIVASAISLTRMEKDTSVKAFIPADHASRVAENKATELFGLSDTIAIAVMSEHGDTIFSAQALRLIGDLSERVAGLPNIDASRVTSLATESSISGDGESVFIENYIDPDDLSAGAVADSEKRWGAMSPHQGTLVSNEGDGAVIMAELKDLARADQTYAAIREMVDALDVDGLSFHVAGPGAVSGFLSSYIDRDARKLQPLVLVLVLCFIFLAFRSLRALPGPLLVVAGAAGGSLGLMALAGIPYFAITNALPVIVVAISVADAIHILSTFYRIREQDRASSDRNLIVRSMAAMCRPITLTTLTTVAGFTGIAAVSIMPPITYFALYAAVGVLLAWVFSIVALPNLLLICKPGRSPAFSSWDAGQPSGIGLSLARLGQYSARHSRRILTLSVVVILVAAIGASKLRIDRSQVDNFAPDEPIRIADELINERFAGTAFLDVIVEAEHREGLLSVAHFQKIRALQEYFETLPHVQKTVSIVDYLGEVHRAIEGEAGVKAPRALPASDDAIGQYLFLYEVSGDPSDLEEEIDSEYRAALVRGILNEHHFSANRNTVDALDAYIRENFAESGLTATLAGDVNVSHHWMTSLTDSHFKGVTLSLLLVLLTSMLVFRSPLTGLVAVIPVAFTVLSLYACMGYLGIYLEPATSMFAAIALGVGVDFAIHLIDRLRSATAEYDGDVTRAIDDALPPVARACFFNSASLGVGFSVLLVSDLPTLARFGGLVATATFTSYLVALVIVPTIFSIGHKRFLVRTVLPKTARIPASVILVSMIALLLIAKVAPASDAISIAENVAAREEGAATRRVIEMTLIDNRDRRRDRVAIIHKRSDETVRKTRITFLAPKKSRDVAFLSYDHLDSASDDERWMYMPVTRRVRRIPAAQRGDAFLGTDFSYEEMQSELKFKLEDWNFTYNGRRAIDGREQHQISGTPRTQRIERELRYGGFSAVIDEKSWMPVRIDFLDLRNRPLKTIQVDDIEYIDGIWTATDIKAKNLQTGHQTRLVIRDIEYLQQLPELLFDASALSRGLPGTGGE